MSNLKRGNKATQFTSDKQPSGKAKSEGHKRKLLLKEIAAQIVSGEALNDLKPLARYLGIPEDKIDIETLMHISQIDKAIKEQDTRAYIAVMDRLIGKPEQSIDHTTKNEKIENIINLGMGLNPNK